MVAMSSIFALWIGAMTGSGVHWTLTAIWAVSALAGAWRWLRTRKGGAA
jgi:hypothetical protein